MSNLIGRPLIHPDLIAEVGNLPFDNGMKLLSDRLLSGIDESRKNSIYLSPPQDFFDFLAPELRFHFEAEGPIDEAVAIVVLTLRGGLTGEGQTGSSSNPEDIVFFRRLRRNQKYRFNQSHIEAGFFQRRALRTTQRFGIWSKPGAEELRNRYSGNLTADNRLQMIGWNLDLYRDLRGTPSRPPRLLAQNTTPTRLAELCLAANRELLPPAVDFDLFRAFLGARLRIEYGKAIGRNSGDRVRAHSSICDSMKQDLRVYRLLAMRGTDPLYGPARDVAEYVTGDPRQFRFHDPEIELAMNVWSTALRNDIAYWNSISGGLGVRSGATIRAEHQRSNDLREDMLIRSREERRLRLIGQVNRIVEPGMVNPDVEEAIRAEAREYADEIPEIADGRFGGLLDGD